MLNITVGADPEFFLLKDGKPVSAHGIVPGTKRRPYKLTKGAVQLDGTAVEFNINPASCANEFADNITHTLEEIRVMVPKEYEFSFTPCVKYDRKYFNTIPDNHKELGCDPDFDATREGAVNPPPQPKGTMRTGAGHLHVGWGKKLNPRDISHMWDCCALVQSLDRILHPISYQWDKDTERARMYGKPGAFRPKRYGVEYRVLSNAWLNHPQLWPWLFKTITWTFNRMSEGKEIPTVVRKTSAQYINTCFLNYYGMSTLPDLEGKNGNPVSQS